MVLLIRFYYCAPAPNSDHVPLKLDNGNVTTGSLLFTPTSTRGIDFLSRWIDSDSGSVTRLLLIITTRRNRVTVKCLLRTIASPSSCIAFGCMLQLKKAMVLRAGHKTGSSASADRDPRGITVLEKTRVFNLGSAFNTLDSSILVYLSGWRFA